MAEESREPEEPQLGPKWWASLRRFLGRIADKLKENFISWLATAILLGIGTTALFIWHPMFRKIQEFLLDRSNISVVAAGDIAHSHVSGKARWSIPFKNVGDPLQYIVTWLPASRKEDKVCDASSPPDWCNYGGGSVYAHLLSGSGERFDDLNLHLPAVAGYMPTSPTDEDQRNLYTAVTDWNNDGKKEILGIADQDAFTSPSHTYFVGFFDTGTRHFDQLKVTASPTENSEEFVGPDKDNQNLRLWLSKRFDEYGKFDGSTGCSRDEFGTLSCKLSAAAHDSKLTAAQREAQAKVDAFDDQMSTLEKRWLDANGPTFTTGKISLEFGAGLLTDKPGGYDGGVKCPLDPGKYELLIVFKGPLALNDIAQKRSTILYMQDGNLSKIPGVIVGKEYIWLALAVHNSKILAIRRSDMPNMTAVPFDVHGWENGIHYVGEDAASNSGDEPKMKDNALDFLDIENGVLIYNGGEVHPYFNGTDVDPLEFAGAKLCEGI
jgi:hypothetical protein